jgi:hypothetical protein
VAELAQPILGMKRGRVSFQRAPATLNRPDDRIDRLGRLAH